MGRGIGDRTGLGSVPVFRRRSVTLFNEVFSRDGLGGRHLAERRSLVRPFNQ